MKKMSQDTVCDTGRLAAEKRRTKGASYLSEHHF